MRMEPLLDALVLLLSIEQFNTIYLLNRVKNQSRVKSSVNYSSLISVKLVSENVALVSGNQSGFSSNSVCNALGAGVSPIPSVNCPQSPIIRNPIVRIRDCILDIDAILRNENVTLNIDVVHSVNRRKCKINLKSVNMFNQYKSNFNFVHVNSQGILDACHLDELKLLLNANRNISLIALTETWLRSNNTNKSIDIPGYKIIRSDRKSKRGDRNKGGGVAIYVLKNFKTKVVLNSFKDNVQIENIEFLFIEIFTRTSKIVFGVVYRAPRCNAENTRKFFDLINSQFVHEQNVLIAGDFNINLLNNSNVASVINSNFALNFSLVNDKCPTHWWPGKLPYRAR